MMRDSIYSLIGTVARGITGLCLFLVLAHAWGPGTFGAFMYPYTVANVLVRLVEYGFALQTVKDIGRDRTRVHGVIADVLGAKTVLAGITGVIAIGYGWFVPGHDSQFMLLFALLLADAIVASFASTFQTPLRATGRFQTDTIVSVVSSSLHFAAVVSAAWLGGGPVAAAIAFVAARLVVLVMTMVVYRRFFGAISAPTAEANRLRRVLLQGLPFGIMVCLATLATQVDTIAVQMFAGTEATGLYQAGMRIVVGALLVADALHNVFLSMVADPRVPRSQRALAGERLSRHLTGFATFVIGMMIAGAPWIIALLFGRRFAALVPILPAFGLIILLRSIIVPHGALLTVAGKQVRRAVGAAMALVITAGLNFLLVPRFGLVGGIAGAAGGQIALAAFYVWGAYPSVGETLIGARTLALVLVAALATSLSAVARQPLLGGALGFATAICAAAIMVRPEEWRHLLATIRNPRRPDLGLSIDEKTDVLPA